MQPPDEHICWAHEPYSLYVAWNRRVPDWERLTHMLLNGGFALVPASWNFESPLGVSTSDTGYFLTGVEMNGMWDVIDLPSDLCGLWVASINNNDWLVEIDGNHASGMVTYEPSAVVRGHWGAAMLWRPWEVVMLPIDDWDDLPDHDEVFGMFENMIWAIDYDTSKVEQDGMVDALREQVDKQRAQVEAQYQAWTEALTHLARTFDDAVLMIDAMEQERRLV